MTDAAGLVDLPGAMTVSGGRTVYGLALGVLMLDTTFPRIHGDVGNARTWPFPVAYKIIRGARPERLARAETDPSLLDPFIDAARELEALGVRAIITSCGFLAAHQRELSSAVSVPVFTSPLLQVPIAAAVGGVGRRVAILTARPVLTERHFAAVGWTETTIEVLQGAPAEDSHFVQTFVGNSEVADIRRLRSEVSDLTERVMRAHPDVGAIVLECANFSPFASLVRRVSSVPVFDLFTLGMHAHLATRTTADRT